MKKSFSFSVRYQIARRCAFKAACFISFPLKTTKGCPSFGMSREHQMSRAIDMILEQILNFYSTSLFK